MSDTRMFRIIICPLSKFLRRKLRYIAKINVVTSHTVMYEYEASHYLDVVLAGFAVVVMSDNVSSVLTCRSYTTLFTATAIYIMHSLVQFMQVIE